MWKKLVSLNLALVMCLALIPSASADYLGTGSFATIFHRNTSAGDTEKKTIDWNLSSFSNLMLYKVNTGFEYAGHVLTSYIDNVNGPGKTYSLTSCITDVMEDAKAPSANLYAQWMPVTDNYIFYIGENVGLTADGKDYILKGNLSGTVKLEGSDAFPSSNIIGWETRDYISGSNKGKYYPEQEITITSNLTLLPITGYNYVVYQFPREGELAAEEVKFYTLGNSNSIQPVGLIDISFDALLYAHKRDEVFYGWKAQADKSGDYYIGLAKDAPHKLYAHTETFPTGGEFCILYSGLGFGTTADRLSITLPLKDGETAKLPEMPAERDGYIFKGWYLYAGGGSKDTKIEDGSSLSKDNDKNIIYARWGKKSEDKTYTITIDGGGTLTTDSTGKLTALPTTPTKPGYIFGGWYTGENGSGTKVEIGHSFTGPATIYPYWIVDSSKPSDKVYVIVIDGGGSVTTGSDGKLTSLPTTPTKPGYIFDGWYTHPTGGDRVDINYVFTGPVTIYPHWSLESTSTTYYRIYTPGWIHGGSYDVSHTYAAPGTRVTIELDPWSDYELDWLSATNLNTGRELSLSERYWDEYTFTMPYSDVEIELSYQERYVRWTSYSSTTVTEAPVKTGPYVWYYQNRHIHHITDGQVPDHTPITRDMFLSVLYNLSGGKKGSGTAVGSETNDAQTWATNERIVPDIYESGLWGLDKSLCRDQAAMLLFRYAGYRGYSASPGESLSHYADYSRVRPIARNGMSWALSTGLMTTTSYNTLSPQSTLTCGQAGDMIYRFEAGVARSW